jgi:hypothetical protein
MNYDDIKRKVDEMVLNTVVPANLRELIENGIIKVIAKSFYVENMQKLPKNVSTMISSTAPTVHGMRITFCRQSGHKGKRGKP